MTYTELQLRLDKAGLWPRGKLARAGWYSLSFAAGLFALQLILRLFKSKYGDSLTFWEIFLAVDAAILFSVPAFGWLKDRMLWRLRNRLIVTYVFIGVIPVVLLLILAIGSFYLLAGQFATYLVTNGLNMQLQTLEASNIALAHQAAALTQDGRKLDAAVVQGMLADLQRSHKEWNKRDVYVWVDGKALLGNSASTALAPALPAYLKQSFREITREKDKLYLRAVETIPAGKSTITVLSSEPLDQDRLQELSASLGQVALFTSGLTLHKVDPTQPTASNVSPPAQPHTITVSKPSKEYTLDTPTGLKPTFVVGSVPPAVNALDLQVSLPTTLHVVDWEDGDTMFLAAVNVQTRISKLYESLFGSLGEFAPIIEVALFVTAGIFAIIELVALIIGTRLTRTVTGSVAQLYEATKRINRGDFEQRIPVKSRDQLATLANSFNSMTASLKELIVEQKEKQRMQNELDIAQEVQAQLFPQHIRQLASLEMYGYCRPARTVSGDYYDFVTVNDEKLILAVGDISGKGISSALLMATIHSAVRAYSVEAIPALREAVAAGSGMTAAGWQGAEVSPGQLLALLNHQLWESTPAEKYATLFLGVYDAVAGRLTYSNGGHLPPIVLSQDGSVRRLEQGGTVVGLFDDQCYEEGSVVMKKGDIFIAFSDGVTEPENDFGEFGEDRLVDLVRENRELPLARITEITTAAVDDWIGANEQPDDITIVLARAR